MHLLINDYAGHEFPIHLGKELVRRGNRVTHSYCSSNVTPHADFASAAQNGIELQPIDLGRSFDKHRLLRRAIDEIDYGLRSAAQLRKTLPDAIVAAQLPVLSLLILQLAARALRVPMVLWLQDIQADIARSQSKRAGRVLEVLETLAMRLAPRIVTISPAMASTAQAAHPGAAVKVIENWADVEKIKPGFKFNSWAVQHDLDSSFNFVYSGTLGVKHRPEALADLAGELGSEPNVKVVVVSQGKGTERLQNIVADRAIENVMMLPLQPAEDLADVLATADVMVALLEEDAAAGCVPSKVLAYLAAGRPILALFPASNLASSIINDRAHAGFAEESTQDFLDAARKLVRSNELRERMGANARSYAEEAFDIDRIADEFEDVLGSHEGATHANSN